MVSSSVFTAESFCWGCYLLAQNSAPFTLKLLVIPTAFKTCLQQHFAFGRCMLEILNVCFEKVLLMSLLFLGQYPHFYPGKRYPFFILLANFRTPAFSGKDSDPLPILTQMNSQVLLSDQSNAGHLIGTNCPNQAGFLSLFHTSKTPVPAILLLPTGPITLAFILFFLVSL